MRKIIIGSEIPSDFDDKKYILYGYLKGDYDKMLSKIYLFEKTNEISYEDLLTFNNLTFEHCLSNSNEVIEYLNNLMNTDFSLSFWEVIINPWWIYMVQYYHFQKSTVLNFLKLHENEILEFEIIDKNDFNFRFKDTNDFISNGLANPDYNHWVISQIIKKLAPENIHFSYRFKKLVQVSCKTRSNFKEKIINVYYVLHNLFFPNIIGLYSLDITSKIRLFNIFKKLTFRYEFSPKKSFFLNSKTNNFFDDIFSEIWKSSLPKSFLNAKIYKSKVRGSILFDSSEIGNDNLKIRMANYRNNRVPIFSFQHGGHNYGTGIISNFLIFDYFFADTLIKWGRYNNNQILNNNIHLPYKQLKKKFIFSNKILKGKIIWVGTHNLNFFFRYDSNLQMSHIVEYRKIKINFFNKILKNLRLKSIFIFRPYYHFKDGINDSCLFKDEFHDLDMYEKKFDFDLYSYAKLLILDHPGTTLNYSFSRNVPTICIWKDNFFKFTNEANDIFQEMKENNLLFNDEYALYDFINSNENIHVWWYSHNVQEIVLKFNLLYSNQKRDWINEWSNYFR